MKRKNWLLIGMIITGSVILYSSFGAAPMVPLWKWFGYTFSIGYPTDNLGLKVLFGALLGAWFMEKLKEQREKKKDEIQD
jgi:hypothetical protein